MASGGEELRRNRINGRGIQYTVQRTRAASDDALHVLGYQRLREALRTGTTHLEAKSGYGLNVETELRLLEVADRLNNIEHTPTIDHTWMGAHDIPSGHNAETYVEELVSEQLPAIVEQNIARSADVFVNQVGFQQNRARLFCGV